MNADPKQGPHRDPTILTPQEPVARDVEAPAYLVIRDALAASIQKGELAPGDKLPSERALAEEHGVARMTARKALGHLEAEGAIMSETRRGYFVSAPRIRYDITSRVNLMRQLRRQGHLTENIYLGREIQEAREWHAEISGVALGERMALERYIVEVEGRKVIYSEEFLILSVFPGYENVPFVSPMMQNVKKRYGFRNDSYDGRLRIANLSTIASQHLGVAPDTVGFTTFGYATWNDQVAMISRAYWRADAWDLIFSQLREDD